MATSKQKKAKNSTTHQPRKLKKPTYKSFRLSKPIKHSATPLPKARKLFSAAFKHTWQGKRLYGGIAAVYLLLALILVKGLGFGFDSQLGDVKDLIENSVGDQSSFVTGAAVFGFLIGNTGSAASEAAGMYQSILLLLVSLALIWALRQTHTSTTPTIKDAFYKGMYPLVPFLLVMSVIFLQLLPLAIGNLLYSIVLSNGLAVTGIEQFIWAMLFGLLALLSLYFLTSSLFALYIVTLPDVAPMQALRSARELVRHRRMMVGRKVFFLPFILLLLAMVIMLPIILYITVMAEFIFFVLSIFAVILSHAYLYELYRELL